MNINDIGFAFVSFNGTRGGKERPILVIGVTEESITFFSITSQYAKKSPQIQKQYCPIVEWQESGLTKSRWVDIGSAREVSNDDISLDIVWSLSTIDMQALAAFIENYNASTQS